VKYSPGDRIACLRIFMIFLLTDVYAGASTHTPLVVRPRCMCDQKSEVKNNVPARNRGVSFLRRLPIEGD
jgi:hypothetical protein